MPRYAARVDANQAVVVAALRACGAEVLSLAPMGGGVPDALVLHRGKLHLMEIKDGAKVKSARALTPAQVEFHKRWPVTVVENVQQALAALVSDDVRASDAAGRPTTEGTK
jgi:hypothetical protein